MTTQNIRLGDKTLRIFTQDDVIYAQVDNGIKHVVPASAEKLTIERHRGNQAKVVWGNGGVLYLEISGNSVTVL